MTRRELGVVVLMASALLVYLVMPNHLLSPQGPLVGVSSASGSAHADGAFRGAGSSDSEMPSDEVTMPPRGVEQASGWSVELDTPWLHGLGESLRGTFGSLSVWPRIWSRLAGPRPVLSVLQVMRC